MDSNDIDIGAGAADEVGLITDSGGTSARKDQLVLVANVVSNLSGSVTNPREVSFVERTVVDHGSSQVSSDEFSNDDEERHG